MTQFLGEDDVARIDADKLLEVYTQRIPICLKERLSKLSPDEKTQLSRRVLVALAKACHDHEFDPNLYLNTKQL
jgi:hypothetical protein